MTGSSNAKHDVLDQKDIALFRRETSDVTRFHSDRRAPEQTLPSPHPRIPDEAHRAPVTWPFADVPSDSNLEVGTELTYRRDGVQASVIRRLRRGHYRCQAEMDLHGLVVETARSRMAEFLHQALASEYRCIRIIHGKGLKSGNRGPVLRNKVAAWLRSQEHVLAYTSAHPGDGGTGVLYVLLKKPR